jgi:hypothetical protein
MSAHYKNGHYRKAVLEDFSEMGMHIWQKNEKFRLKWEILKIKAENGKFKR